MTQDEIIRMAREADIPCFAGMYVVTELSELERFAALVATHEKKFWMEQIEVECNEAVLAERELCAKLCDGIERHKWEILTKGGKLEGLSPIDCAAAIRARGEK